MGKRGGPIGIALGGLFAAETLGDSSLPSYWTVSGTALGRDTGRARSRRPKRWRMFRHYGYAAQSMWFRGGLRPGSYATHALGRPMSGFTAQDQLALKHRLPPDAYYNVFVPPDHPVIGPDPVRRVEDDERKIFRNGGGVEFQFPTGTPPGTVRGPYPIPPGRPIPFRPE